MSISLKPLPTRPFYLVMNNAANTARFELRTTALATVPGQIIEIDGNEEIPAAFADALESGKLELWMVTDAGERKIDQWG